LIQHSLHQQQTTFSSTGAITIIYIQKFTTAIDMVCWKGSSDDSAG